jgi:hypothetical protein
MKEKLKVGILLDNYLIPAWVYKLLEEIIHSDFAEIKLLVRNSSTLSSITKKKKTLGFKILKFHERIDRLIFKNLAEYSLKKDSSILLHDVIRIVIDPIVEDAISSIKAEDLMEIKKYELDVILNFGFVFLKGDIIRLPKYGIWSYRMGLDNLTDTVSPGYWEIVGRCPVTSSVLEILNEDSEKGTIIYCALDSTYAYSINVNRNRLYWRASLFVPRILKVLFDYGDSYLGNLKSRFENNSFFPDESLLKVPQAIPAVLNIFRHLSRVTEQVFKRLLYSVDFNWFLLIKIDNSSPDSYSTSFKNFRKLKSSEEKFWADPFIISCNRKFYLFVEEFIYRTSKGHISVIELDYTGNILGAEIIIDRPYHMSYPFIFEKDNNYFMIPETSQNKTIELYKCIDFPYKWEFTKNILKNISAVDTTLFFFNNKYWLFTCVDETNNNSEGSTELFLFYSDDIFSDNWTSHPCNPIISDVRTARPAGKLFVSDNKIYRPSQDCSERYGKGFNLSHVTKLSESEYEEILVEKIVPKWNKILRGTHTFNFDKNITVIDAYSYRRRRLFRP